MRYFSLRESFYHSTTACSIALGPQTLSAEFYSLCGLIVGGAMGYAGGESGGALGEVVGNEVYKVFEQ